MSVNATLDPFLPVLDRYAAAVRAKDVAAYMALYDDDVRVFDLWADWSLHGIKAWRDLTVDWFASLGSEYVVVSAADTNASASGDLAIGHAFLTYSAFSAEGQRLRWLSNRITVGLRRSGEAWKIIHQHTSSPIDHASLKAKLQRTP
jgi:ketosteroid isomerase-like protein